MTITISLRFRALLNEPSVLKFLTGQRAHPCPCCIVPCSPSHDTLATGSECHLPRSWWGKRRSSPTKPVSLPYTFVAVNIKPCSLRADVSLAWMNHVEYTPCTRSPREDVPCRDLATPCLALLSSHPTFGLHSTARKLRHSRLAVPRRWIASDERNCRCLPLAPMRLPLPGSACFDLCTPWTCSPSFVAQRTRRK